MEINELIGKKFKYKSKYGGLSDWTQEIIDVSKSHVKVTGIGDPLRYINTKNGEIPMYGSYETEQVYSVISKNGVKYKINEIEIMD